MARRLPRLEWISIVYLALFVLAVLAPSIYSKGYLGFSETQLEEFTIFIFGLAGLVTFALYERVMERREREREEARLDYQRAQQELIESYAYIGSVNRKLELLKRLSNETTLNAMDASKLPKDVFQSLAMHACSTIGAEAALLRFIDMPKLRTEREFIFSTQSNQVFRVANKDLRALHERGDSHAFVRSEDGRDVLVVPSDRTDRKAHLLFLMGNEAIPELDLSLIKVFANHAEMLYRNFASEPDASKLVNVTV